MYDVPSAAGGDAGLEGFALEIAGERVGRVAALNRTGEGTVLIVDTGDAYHALPARAVERIERLRRAVTLTPAGEEAYRAAPPVEARVLREESPRLVRHIPAGLARLLVEGEPPPPTRRQWRWVVATSVGTVGGLGLFIGGPLAFGGPGAGSPLRWLWIAIPAAIFLVGVALAWRAFAAATPDASRAQRLSDASTAVLGVSPRTHRRG